MTSRSAAVLVSGGWDSLVLLAWARARHARVYPVYVRCGLRWERAELHHLRRFLKDDRRPGVAPLTVLNLPMKDVYGAHWSRTGRGVPGARSRDSAVYLPGRNALLLTKAGVFAATRGVGTLYIGVLSANPFGDASPSFFRAQERALSLALRTPLRLRAPFRRLDKGALKRWAQGLPARHAFSCLNPRGVSPCGRCNKCAELRRILVK
jgi:7-cyano-7-deazaguanine synthase